MKVIYANQKVERQCTSLKAARKLFGGDKKLAEKLFSRINALTQAENLTDIIAYSPFHFHKLSNKGRHKLEGYYAIDVSSRASPWRLIVQPLNDDEEPFTSSGIDEIAATVKIVEVSEVSKHYE